jgi:hypothetical protein
MVWTRLLNLPKVLRTYEVLWAVGTMFGATQKVDMVTTRESKFGRFKVVVLNPTIVPTKINCVIGTRFFELQFEIESFVASREIVQSGPKENTGGDGSGNHDGDTKLENANKKAKNWTSQHQNKVRKQKVQKTGNTTMLMVLWKILMMMIFYMMLGK